MKYLVLSVMLATAAISQTHDHHAEVNKRGDHVMGFSHEKTVHHFRLYEHGGAIEVDALDSKDKASQDQIRMHLTHIASKFSAGDFQAPMLIHGKNPPGVATLEKLKAEVKYDFAATKLGGTVQIKTTNKEALKAVHEFLRFQISDHKTGDALTVAQ